MNDTMRRHALVLTIALASTLAPVYAQQPANPPLKNWAAPLYWHPTEAERQTAGRAVPELKFSANQISADALTFVAITPCRLVDTRGAAAGFIGVTPFNGPGVPAGGGSLTFPVQSSAQTSTTAPAPCGAIPTIAAAYSINLTVVPAAGGAVDNVSLWPSGSAQPFVATLNDPQGAIAQNAAIVPAGTPFGGFSFHSTGPAATDIIIDMNGYYAAPTDLNFNTAIGLGTLSSNTTGEFNTATGDYALALNTTGSFNTASGNQALHANTTGSGNTASGGSALGSNTTGNYNTATGASALQDNTTGSNNTASGLNALQDNTTGNNNTASGFLALQLNTTGVNNTATGDGALQSNTTACCNTSMGFVALADNTTGANNTAFGDGALQSNTTACCNTASGFLALQFNTTGANNTATGDGALQSNTTGNNNTAIGDGALQNSTTACCNTSMGFVALAANTTGTNNVASGDGALQNNTTGSGNTVTGAFALQNNTTGGNNIALGYFAALNVSGANSNNIHIGSQGVSTDSGVIKIGTAGSQTSAYIAGISGVTASGGVEVFVNSSGQLGTINSSRRFKEQITDMGYSSSKLLQLRPVNFFYKPEYDDGSHLLQYGLIAEEVAKVYPEMVAYDKDGQILTVRYQMLAPMLLNEVQKQNAQIQKQNAQLQSQDSQLQNQVLLQQEENRKLEEQNRKLEDRLAALEAMLSGQTSTGARPASSQ